MTSRGQRLAWTFALAAFVALALAAPAKGQPIRRVLPPSAPGEIDLVLVPVAVADWYYKPFLERPPDRVQLFEDGVEQELTYFGRGRPWDPVTRASLRQKIEWVTVRNDRPLGRGSGRADHRSVDSLPYGPEVIAGDALREFFEGENTRRVVLKLPKNSVLLSLEYREARPLQGLHVFVRLNHGGAAIGHDFLNAFGPFEPGEMRVAVMPGVPYFPDQGWEWWHQYYYTRDVAHYVVGYRPKNARMDGAKRKVKVVLHFDNPTTRFRLRYPKSYRMPG